MILCLSRSCEQSLHAAGWAEYVSEKAAILLHELGLPSDAVVHPQLHKLILYKGSWVAHPCGGADLPPRTVATLLTVLPSQCQVCMLLVHGQQLVFLLSLTIRDLSLELDACSQVKQVILAKLAFAMNITA